MDDAALSTACRVGQDVWVGSILGALTIGLVGVLPLFLVSSEETLLQGGKLTPMLRTMLGFACGGLLANAFLHLLPEAFGTLRGIPAGELWFIGMVPVNTGEHHGFNEHTYVGLWVILGILVFVILEKMVDAIGGDDDADDDTTTDDNDQKREVESSVADGDGSNSRRKVTLPSIMGCTGVNPAGYLNLLVNSLDNFTHGLAIAGSFCVSNQVGLYTTLAIVIHEVPHEIGDYAVLIRSGFDKRQAITSQFVTSAGSILGAIFGLMCADRDNASIWILPFTSGGFIYIALVSLIPDMYEQNMPGFAWWRDVANVSGGIALVGLTQLLPE